MAGLLGLRGVALLDAASYLMAGALIALIHVETQPAAETRPAPEAATAWARVWREWLAGLRLVKQEQVLAVIFLMIAITQVGEGIMGVLFVVFVNRILGGGALEIGWLMSAQAVGGLIGGLFVGSLGRVPPSRLIGLSAVAFGLIDLAIFNYPTFFPGITLGIVLFIVVGVPGVGLGAAFDTLLQTAVADEYRGRIFGALGTTGALLRLVGMGLAGALGDVVGVVPMLNLQGGGYILAGVLGLVMLRGVGEVALARRQGQAYAD